MANEPGGEAARRRRWMGRAFIATVIPVGLVAAGAHPALADPASPSAADAPPDSGAFPIPNQTLRFPATPQASPAAAAATMDPVAAEIVAASNEAQRLGEQVKALEDDATAARAVTDAARGGWERAKAVLAGPTATSTATTPTTGPPTSVPSSPSPTASGMGTTAPTTSSTTSRPSTNGGPAADSRLSNRAEATRAEREAKITLDAAIAAEQEVVGRREVVAEQFHRHQAAWEILTTRNGSQLASAQRARDAYELSLAASRGAGASIDGMQASPEALAAVAFALSQLGKPYAWATQGPSTYDCSGLVLASYLSVGVKLPRVANNQYGAGQPVLASQLLPGDLIFFSTNPFDWRQIHHVAMYIGNNQVVQAPTFGDVVKVSPIWWSEYFGASRIVPAVPVPGATPEPTPAEVPSPETPSPSASTPSQPVPTPPQPTTPAPTPTGTPTGTTTGTTTEPPTTAPGPTGTTTPTTTPTPTPTPTPNPTPDPAVSLTATPTQHGRRRLLRG